MNETPNGPFSNYDEKAETPNGAFPNYVEEQTETRQQYIDRIFGQWLEWAEGQAKNKFLI